LTKNKYPYIINPKKVGNIMENKYKRIVIKVGTSSITYPTGKINLGRMEELAKIVSDLKNRGYEIVLVSSGAIGAGVGKMGLDEKPADTRHKQALAAIGQASLVSMYDRFFSNFGYSSAQVLLTKYVFDDEEKYNNAHNAFEIMFGYGVIPIVNENDVISIDEIEVGDNDSLSAYVGKMVNADLVVILSDIDGFFDADPTVDPDAKIIPVIDEIDEEVLSKAGGAGTRRGTGGMITKLNAAKMVMPCGIDMIIANSNDMKKLYDIVDGKQVGTLFKGKA